MNSDSPNTALVGRPVAFSRVENGDIVQPFDVNVYGTLFGGKLLSLIDKTAALSAFRHWGLKVVTLSIDSLVFKNPAPVGTLLTLRASVNRVFNTSMEVGVIVTGIMPGSKEEFVVCPAYLTFVGIGQDGKPAPVPPVIPESPDEIRRFQNALLRRNHRMLMQSKLQKTPSTEVIFEFP